jgi:hypothetical protein
MLPDFNKLSRREKTIVAGLYFAKFDSDGLVRLGFRSFLEAFNVIGFALGARPASIKNYRDEFDPLFPNRRKGWRNRAMREHCLVVYEKYGALDLELFSELIKSCVNYDDGLRAEQPGAESSDEAESTFAKRLVTGLAAEKYFESVQPALPEFNACLVTNTTKLGCGFDFRLTTGSGNSFLAVEVKGLTERTGGVSLTSKEYAVAEELTDRYFLFVVKNFRENPCHTIYRDPLHSDLRFARKERVTVQISWLTSV